MDPIVADVAFRAQPDTRVGRSTGRSRIDTVTNKTLSQCFSELVFRVVGIDFSIRSQNRTEKIAELEVDRRRIIESANNQCQQVNSDSCAFSNYPAAIENTGRDLAQRLQPFHPDTQKCIHDCGDKNLAATVWLFEFLSLDVIA